MQSAADSYKIFPPAKIRFLQKAMLVFFVNLTHHIAQLSQFVVIAEAGALRTKISRTTELKMTWYALSTVSRTSLNFIHMHSHEFLCCKIIIYT